MKSVALLTDFGHLDTYAGVIKMLIQSQVPTTLVWDICHEVDSFSVLNGGYHLLAAYNSLPRNSILMAIVDPGVGTSREIIMVQHDSRIILCPNNGIISLWGKKYLNDANCYKVLWNNTPDRKFRSVSPTFHGRDVFTPIAINILQNGTESLLLESIEPLILEAFLPQPLENVYQGLVLNIDRFGNLITNLPSTMSTPDFPNSVLYKNNKWHTIHQTYGDVSEQQSLCYWGSSGFLEIAIRENSAAQIWNSRIGDPVFFIPL